MNFKIMEVKDTVLCNHGKEFMHLRFIENSKRAFIFNVNRSQLQIGVVMNLSEQFSISLLKNNPDKSQTFIVFLDKSRAFYTFHTTSIKDGGKIL